MEKNGENSELTAKELKFCQGYVNGGFSVHELAEEVGIGITTYYRWVNKPRIQAKISEFAALHDKYIQCRLRGMAEKAAETLIRCMGSKQDEVARKASIDVMKYILGDPSRSINNNVNNNTPIGEVRHEYDIDFDEVANVINRQDNNRGFPSPPSRN